MGRRTSWDVRLDLLRQIARGVKRPLSLRTKTRISGSSLNNHIEYLLGRHLIEIRQKEVKITPNGQELLDLLFRTN